MSGTITWKHNSIKRLPETVATYNLPVGRSRLEQLTKSRKRKEKLFKKRRLSTEASLRRQVQGYCEGDDKPVTLTRKDHMGEKASLENSGYLHFDVSFELKFYRKLKATKYFLKGNFKMKKELKYCNKILLLILSAGHKTKLSLLKTHV